MTKPLSKSGFSRVEPKMRQHSSGTYYARFKIGGKIITKSLATKSLTVARLRLPDLVKLERAKYEARKRAGTTAEGILTVRGATDIFFQKQDDLVVALKLKPRSVVYNRELVKAIEKTWPELMAKDVTAITKKQCQTWAEKYRRNGTGFKQKGAKKALTGISPQRFNATIRTLRRIFKIPLDDNQIYENPVQGIEMMSIRNKPLVLPSRAQFQQMITTIETAKGRTSRACADMVRFLAYSGCRIGEAHRVLFKHVDLEQGKITIMGDPVTGTKNWESRVIPIIAPLRETLERMMKDRCDAKGEHPVLLVRECQKALNRAAALVGAPRVTHHGLRHLFATTCIQSGVDIPTVSKWLGHKDGGTLAMKTYSHLTDEHSAAAAKKVKFE